MGLEYICTTAERFFAVGRVLGNMVVALAEQPSSRLLKHIIRCYLRLSDNPRLVICCYIVLLPFNALDFQKMRPQTPSSLLLYRACDALRSCLPDILRDATTFSNCLHVSMVCVLNYVFYRGAKNHIAYWWIKDGIHTEPEIAPALPRVIPYIRFLFSIGQMFIMF